MEFPQAYLWLEGSFIVLWEDGHVEIDSEGPAIFSRLGIRKLAGMAEQFMYARERRANGQ